MPPTLEDLGLGASDFVKLAIRGDRPALLALVFSHVEEPAGRFTFERSVGELGWDAILLNVPDRSYYLRGIPGLGGDLEATLAALRGAIDRLAPGRVVALGTSMGGFGALLFGARLGVDRVLAIGAETELMLRGSRSRGFIADRFVPCVADLRPAIAASQATRFFLLAGETDVADIHAAWRVADLPHVGALPVRNAEHEVGRWLTRRERLLPFLRAFADGAPLDPLLDLGDALRDPRTVEALQRGHDALLRFKAQEAVGPLLAAIGFYPGYAMAHHLLGRAYSQLARHDAALRAHRRAIELDPETAQLRVSLAEALVAGNLEAEAERALAEIIAAHPRAAAAHHLAAQLRARRGDAAAAAESLRHALEVEPRNALFLSTQANFLGAAGRWTEAVETMRAAVAINPLRGELHLQLAIAASRAGLTDAARAAFARALELEPANAEFRRLAAAAEGIEPPLARRA